MDGDGDDVDEKRRERERMRKKERNVGRGGGSGEKEGRESGSRVVISLFGLLPLLPTSSSRPAAARANERKDQRQQKCTDETVPSQRARR